MDNVIGEVDYLLQELQVGVRNLSQVRENLKTVQKIKKEKKAAKTVQKEVIGELEDPEPQAVEVTEDPPTKREISLMVDGKEVNIIAIRPKLIKKKKSLK